MLDNKVSWTDEEDLYTTEIIFGKGLFIITKKDNVTNKWKQVIFNYDEWDKINELVFKHKKEE